MLPEVASQKQGSGAMQASVEMVGSSRAPATITAPFEGSDNQEVSFTGLVLGDDALISPFVMEAVRVPADLEEMSVVVEASEVGTRS